MDKDISKPPSIPQIYMWVPSRTDQIVSSNYFFYFCPHKIVKGIQMLLNQSPNLPNAKVSTNYRKSTSNSYIT